MRATEALYAKRERFFRHNAEFLIGWSRLSSGPRQEDEAKNEICRGRDRAMFDTKALGDVARARGARRARGSDRHLSEDRRPGFAESGPILTPQIDKLTARLEPKTPPAPASATKRSGAPGSAARRVWSPPVPTTAAASASTAKLRYGLLQDPRKAPRAGRDFVRRLSARRFRAGAGLDICLSQPTIFPMKSGWHIHL